MVLFFFLMFTRGNIRTTETLNIQSFVFLDTMLSHDVNIIIPRNRAEPQRCGPTQKSKDLGRRLRLPAWWERSRLRRCSENHSKTMENMKMVPLYWLLSGVRARRDDTNGLPLDVRHLLHPTIFPRQIQTICVLVVEKNFSQSKTLNNVKSYSIESFCKQLALA